MSIVVILRFLFLIDLSYLTYQYFVEKKENNYISSFTIFMSNEVFDNLYDKILLKIHNILNEYLFLSTLLLIGVINPLVYICICIIIISLRVIYLIINK